MVINPVFILGPGRGGTTLLYKMLCLHPDTACITNYDLRPWARPLRSLALALGADNMSVKRRAWFSRDGQAYLARRKLLARLVPMPVEGEALYRKCGLTGDESSQPASEQTGDALRRSFSHIQSRSAATVILKRTANNRRIPVLESIFPDARYLVLWRDGRAVVNSLLKVHWWLDHKVWWAGNATPRQMNLDRSAMVALAARNWSEEVRAIEQGLAGVAPSRVLELRYEQLVAEPATAVGAALRFLGMRVTDDYLEHIHSVVSSPVAQKWRSAFAAGELALIEGIIGDPLRRLGYV